MDTQLLPPILTSILIASIASLASCAPFDAEFSPVAVIGIEPAASVSAGGDHTCVVLANGNSGCWGDNENRQLGFDITDADGATVSSTSDPTFLPLARDAVEIASGGTATCARFAGGEVECFGANLFGELGFEASCNGEQPTEFSCALAEPTMVPGLSGAMQLSVGGPIAIAKDSNGSVRAVTFTCARMVNGSVQCWGANDYGQAGGSPSNVSGPPAPIVDREGFPLRGIVDIATGDSHTCVLEDTGGVRCWGRSNYGQRGPVGPDDRIEGLPGITAIDAGSEHTCAVSQAGEVWCWGQNFANQSGADSGIDSCPEGGASDAGTGCVVVPERIAGVRSAVDVALGDRHSCALLESGGVTCWGGNQSGQLGVPERSLALPAQVVPLAKPAIQLSAGRSHGCALHDGGSLSCWGGNGSGQVGVPRQ